MPLLTNIVTQDGKQIGTLEDGTRVLLSNPIPDFNHQEVSKRVNEKKPHLRDDLKNQARKDSTYFHQIGTYKLVTPLEIITYIKWEGKPIEK
jgi:hypothetical protein